MRWNFRLVIGGIALNVLILGGMVYAALNPVAGSVADFLAAAIGILLVGLVALAFWPVTLFVLWIAFLIWLL